MSYPEAINYLYGLQKYGIKLGLEKTGIILSRLGNPHKDFLSIHVAGTNGKGSVSAMTASVLMVHGFKVGLFTSPHLVSFTERIRINNEQISESDVVSLTEEIRSKISDLKSQIPEPTFFEFVTAMAFLYFSRVCVDWAVIETGMGGRLDATNIITPEVSVITKISYDHKEFLGETLADIAYEKAGIIKKGIPVVSAHQDKEAGEVIAATVKERSSPLFIYGRDFSGELRLSDIEGITFDYFDDSCTITDLHTPLAGEHQIFNACMATKAAMVALNRAAEQQSSRAILLPFSTSALREGLSSTQWHGRLEIVSNNPMIMIDGAHNPDAAKALSEFIKKHLNDYRIILILGIMADKNIHGIMSPLLPVASEIIFTAPDYGRAASPQKLAEIALHMGFPSRIANSVRDAIEMAKNLSSSLHHSITPSLILITGSFYTIGEAMEMLGKKAVLGTLRETI
ncbi:MAG: folylpolyglutamate synthase/dihydrofolate synthase family protein [Thermodesulfovibrionales bacterium]|jgi:dihydrofolate synthase/folylpolyglutamate synthase|nr:folylpolyglutamate synthase/dihydrofolate synthase family protein [Thermodesulfovibrionales bacterium]